MDKFAHFFSIFFLSFFLHTVQIFLEGWECYLGMFFFFQNILSIAFFYNLFSKIISLSCFFPVFLFFFSLLVENVDNVFFIVYLNWWINVTKFLEIFTLWKYLLLWNQRIQTNCLRNKKWYPIPILGILNQF